MLHSRLLITICLVLFSTIVVAHDSTTIQVHFLYGSKPKKEYKDTEHKWFGGILGGHVGVEIEKDNILNFVPSGKFHILEKKEKHSQFVHHDFNGFYSLFGTIAQKVKKIIIEIPISKAQKQKLDSLSKAYRKSTPYDYAFMGKRCGSAAYDILSQADILPKWSHRKTYLKIFYPRKLRKRLLERAKTNRWQVTREKGTTRRKWEKD